MIELPDNVSWILWIIPIFLYAEVHYRIGKIFSRYFAKEPEIVADVPWRVERGQLLPVLLIVKDAHYFPIELTRVSITASLDKNRFVLLDKYYDRKAIKDSFWHKVFECTYPKAIGAWVEIDVRIEYLINHILKICHNDNYKLLSHKPFKIFIDEDPLPGEKFCQFGDMHVHSNFTNDQVEFGAPIDATLKMARAMGHRFVAITDHSYDLDDREDNYIQKDVTLTKWKKFWQEVNGLNRKNRNFFILGGEELSVGNNASKNVHLLLLNNRQFVHGDGDSAEKWLQNKPSEHVSEIVPHLEKNVISFAAHPATPPPWIQKVLIRRGTWEAKDYQVPNLDGLQMWNGDKNFFLNFGLAQWIELLLSGHRLTLIAGNDAHGNFNRFRQIAIPHVTMREVVNEVFGTARTGLLFDKRLSENNVINIFKKGRIIVTDGPYAEFTIEHKNHNFRIGDTFCYKNGVVKIRAQSSSFFGTLQKLELVVASLDQKKEAQKYEISLSSGCFEILKTIQLSNLPPKGYIRLQVTSKDSHSYHCFTNPIYIDCFKSV